MTTNKKKALAATLTGGALLLVTSGASFGFPVEDFGSYAYLAQEVEQAIQMVTTAKASLTSFQNNLKNFSVKNLWQTTPGTLPNDNVGNTYGETAGWTTALNNNTPSAATTAWSQANLQVNPGTYLAGQTPGSSADLSSLAMIEAFDASSPNCLNAVGQYRALRASNAPAESSLESQQLDTGADSNTEIEQLNLLNASDAQGRNEQQAQGVLHACLAEQTTIANMAQRNVAAQMLNDAALIQTQHANNDVTPANESNTWQNYVP